jgi:IS5 family transposase
MAIQSQINELIDILLQIYDISYRKEILGEKVPNSDKLFSIFERHTDIIVKGSREIKFGHKVTLATGKSNLILDIQTLKGNPSDSNLYQPTINRIELNYGKVPHDNATDGGYASCDNMDFSKNKGIINIVFNKIVGCLQNTTTSKKIETQLKKWRSGIEANISNWKRGFNISKCNWKGFPHFESKVIWSAIAYNFRVFTAMILEKHKLLTSKV